MVTSDPHGLSDTVLARFHGETYQVEVSTPQADMLHIQVELQTDASLWRGNFTAKYIEDITAKTGNFKKFPMFVRMLLSALRQESDCVFVDLLSLSDLEALKARHGKAASGSRASAGKSSPPASSSSSNKRYMILTYVGEFDRVHYPLPLSFDDQPDPALLRSTITRLRQELQAARAAAGPEGLAAGEEEAHAELLALREENHHLWQRVRQLQEAQAAAAVPAGELGKELKLVRKERDVLQMRLEASEAELERQRGLHRRELRRRARELQDKEAEFARVRQHVSELRLRCRQLSAELELANRRTRPRSTALHAGRTTSPGRAQSARPSPTSSRAGTPGSRAGYSRQAASAEHTRPRSAPSARKPRFDPTEYVRQKRERERLLAERQRRGGGGSSRGSSGRSTPNQSRHGSARSSHSQDWERPWRAGAASPSRTSCSSAHNGLPPPERSSSPYLARRKRSSSPGQRQGSRASSTDGETPESRRRERGWSDSVAVGGGEERAGKGAASARSREAAAGGPPVAVPQQPGSRSQSPGRALADVKQRLADYAQRQAQPPPPPPAAAAAAAWPAPAPSASSSDAKPGVYHSASAEIADIDSRLQALQNFLRLAKTQAPAHSS